ncbi:zinc finger protein 585B-like [Nymphalis io]|uniref:zinc finger protein 585B-like n=1 Tax=Inachis io TaxID=171585 RepID=UPI00216A1936|nr:zinc finger protein 585B-like [Nymphalis io]XP_050346749.1 zinc finger protein 585B-like [Nymphalis io]
MMKCKICLRSSENIKMTPFNEKYVSHFNLLTNLKIQLCDTQRQQLCEYCLEMLNLFVDFRNKCILAHTAIVQDNYVVMKNEQKDECNEINYITNENIKIETDVKNDKSSDDEHFQNLIDVEDHFVNDLLETVIKTETIQASVNKQKKEVIVAPGFPCGLCAKIFTDKSILLNHLDIHRSKYDKICLLCSEKFSDWQQLLSHRLDHVPWKDKTCHLCSKRFQSSIYLEHHYKNVHSPNEKTQLRCVYCYKIYKTPRQLRKHIWGCHSNKKFICDYCSKEFTSKQQIRIHIVIHLENKPFACDLCEFSCKFIGNLKSHKLRKHTPKRVCCNKCNRVFGNQLIHDNHKCVQKLSVCSKCGKTFQGTKQLTRHMSCHEAAGRYRCERCPAVYKTRDALRAHCDRHDGVRSKRCEYCPKTFYTTSVLIKHRRTHTGIKPYVCRICQKAFTGNNNLKVHMRVHGEYVIKKKNQYDLEKPNNELTN